MIGFILGFFIHPKQPIPLCTIMHTMVLGILNIIRSIEPLVYVIVFAVIP
ncbi:MAG: hypothetical protein AAF902_15245 [Chloroflexota bacterium]